MYIPSSEGKKIAAAIDLARTTVGYLRHLSRSTWRRPARDIGFAPHLQQQEKSTNTQSGI